MNEDRIKEKSELEKRLMKIDEKIRDHEYALFVLRRVHLETQPLPKKFKRNIEKELTRLDAKIRKLDIEAEEIESELINKYFKK